MSIKDWSSTAASNTTIDSINIAENCPFANMNDMGRALMANIRQEIADQGATVTAATLSTISGASQFKYLTGGTTISAFDTAVTGLYREMVAASTLVLAPTTALGLTGYPGNISLEPGALIKARSLGAGNWVVHPERATGRPMVESALLTDGGTSGYVLTGNGAGSAPTFQEIASGFPTSYLSGLVVSNNGTDANNDIDVSAGKARDGGDTADMVLGSAITKQLDAAWAVGTNQGGLDTGTEATGTWYYVWLIKRADTGVVDVLFSTSKTAPTMPANYTLKRLIGAIYNNGSGNIAAFKQRTSGRQRVFMFNSPVLDIDATNPGTSAVNRTLTVPTLGVDAFINLGIYADGGVVNTAYVSATDQTDLAPQPQATAALASPGASVYGAVVGWNFSQATVWADTSSQIRSRLAATSAATRLGIVTLGWMYEF